MGDNPIYQQIVSQRGRLETLIAKIPGFKGYHEMNARREADRLLRDHLAGEIERCVTQFSRIENKILDAGGLKHMSRTRAVKSRLQSYAEQVSTAAPKYAGMFAEVKIGTDELDRIYAFDEAQFRYVTRFEDALDALEAAVKAGGDFEAELEAVATAADEASDAFQLRDDEILQLSEKL
jgi:hypothetical protein